MLNAITTVPFLQRGVNLASKYSNITSCVWGGVMGAHGLATEKDREVRLYNGLYLISSVIGGITSLHDLNLYTLPKPIHSAGNIGSYSFYFAGAATRFHYAYTDKTNGARWSTLIEIASALQMTNCVLSLTLGRTQPALFCALTAPPIAWIAFLT